MKCFSFALLLLGLAACVPVPQERMPSNHAVEAVQAPDDFPQHIAILPVENVSNDADGPTLLRYFMSRELSRIPGCFLQRIDDTDHLIQERMIGGPDLPVQVFLARQDPAMLASWLGVDGVLHGQLLRYSKEKILLYVQTSVEIHLWLVDASGKKVWEVTRTTGDSGMSSGSVSVQGDLFDGSMPEEVRHKAYASELARPLLEQVEDAFHSFPQKK